MKVLFAVNNDDISNAIVKNYQRDYKQILSYKNVYYFNAILKELQRDKSYDRVVISEDLEPFANNNYDTIDKFLFDKLDSISDEATNAEGTDTDIILICTDRRSKSDEMLNKLFGIGVYNAIIGQDRSIDEVCKLIYKPRNKKEAKMYYKIDTENVNYQSENEESVSEIEVQNILAHYARLGKNEDKYVESFNSIVPQYTDNQLKIIIRYLPMGVKAVLEAKSPKYQELVNSGDTNAPARSKFNQYNVKKIKGVEKSEGPYKVQMLKGQSEKSQMRGPVVIPSSINKTEVKRLIEDKKPEIKPNVIESIPEIEPDIIEKVPEIETNIDENILETDFEDNINENIEGISQLNETETVIEPQKRGRGRPRKILTPEEQEALLNRPKRGRGRPRKIQPEEAEQEESIDLFSFDESDNEEEPKDYNRNEESNDEIDLFSLDDENDLNDVNEPQGELEKNENQDEDEEDIDLFSLNDEDEEDDRIAEYGEENQNNVETSYDEEEDVQDESDLSDEDDLDLFNIDSQEEDYNKQEKDYNENEIVTTKIKSSDYNLDSLMTKDKKIVSFVGTTKNGTSFIVNNVAHLMASRGIKTAILDMTKSKNAYYIFTNSDKNLMKTAEQCIYKLRSGVADGVKINKNLDVYVSVPDEDVDFSDIESILGTLVKNYSLVLIDCDFDTPMEYFDASNETYLVQSMDVLTMQPLTAFLRNLQSKGILKQEKLRVVINKSVDIRSVPVKTLIGGISKYNNPSMTYMKDLFDKDVISYCQIPFEIRKLY